MKNYSLLVVALLGLLFYSCQSEQGGHSHEDCCPHPHKGMESHNSGGGSDPPPCPTCGNKINPGDNPLAPRSVVSFEGYGFIQFAGDMYVLYPKSKFRNINSGEKVYFNKATHYLVDADLDTATADSVLIYTGIKIDLVTSISNNPSSDLITGTVAASSIANTANKLRLSGLENAGYIESDGLYLSQLYGYLGEMRNLKDLKVHLEKMELYLKDTRTEHQMLIAVDIQKRVFNHHAFGTEGH